EHRRHVESARGEIGDLLVRGIALDAERVERLWRPAAPRGPVAQHHQGIAHALDIVAFHIEPREGVHHIVEEQQRRGRDEDLIEVAPIKERERLEPRQTPFHLEFDGREACALLRREARREHVVVIVAPAAKVAALKRDRLLLVVDLVRGPSLRSRETQQRQRCAHGEKTHQSSPRNTGMTFGKRSDGGSRSPFSRTQRSTAARSPYWSCQLRRRTPYFHARSAAASSAASGASSRRCAS